MQLKEFTLISPVIAATDVSRALETVITPTAIEQRLLETDSLLSSATKVALDCLSSVWRSLV